MRLDALHKASGTSREQTQYFSFQDPRYEIPKQRLKEVTYARIVVDYKPYKLEKYRSRITAGGDRINCDYDTSAPTCDLTTIKLHWNSVLSTLGAKYATFDISNFYLGTLLDIQT